MSALLTMLQSTIREGSISRLSEQIGADSQTTSNAVDAALPLLIGALSRSTKKDRGVGLERALETAHDGTILNDVSGYIARNDRAEGNAILRHVLGQNKDLASQLLGSSAGIDKNQAASLLATLAPVLLGALGKAKAQNRLSGRGLTDLLAVESNRLQEHTPSMMNAVRSMLNADGGSARKTGFKEFLRRGREGFGRFLR